MTVSTPDKAQKPATKLAPKAKVTPMMAQYLEIKQANSDSLLFYRMGDFYELFFDDAEIAATALGIALTKRGKHMEQDIPMCGVPVHAADGYLEKLIRLGHKVSVCEQTEDPAEAKKRGSKSVVRREVVRLVTPGTITEDNLLQANQNNYLACLSRNKADDAMALAWLDMSSGEFAVTEVSVVSLLAELVRLDASELIVSDSILADEDLTEMLNTVDAAITCLPASRYDSTSAAARLQDYYNVKSLDAYGDFSRAATAAAGVLLGYVMMTQVGRAPSLHPPQIINPGDVVLIDAATRSNLELTKTLAGEKAGSLLHCIDMTVTGAGSRMLAERLSSPLTNVAEIVARHDAIEAFIEGDGCEACSEIRNTLQQVPDTGRSLARVSLGRGSPRDLAAIATAVQMAARLAQTYSERGGIDPWPSAVNSIWARLQSSDTDYASHVEAMLADELPATTRDGGFIRAGANADLDECRRLRDESRQVIAGLQSQYVDETGIKTLKVKHNNMLGYFIELNQQAGEKLLSEEHTSKFIHRQTMANAMRFTTTELAGLEREISLAAERARSIEMDLFQRLVDETCERAGMLHTIAQALSELDVYCALAELAVQRNYVRPYMDNSRCFDIQSGRHPVVEAALHKQSGATFVPNGCNLTAEEQGADNSPTKHIIILTGPNMAGKSTFLRQNAIIALMAQIGSYVPAEAARIGVVDRIFSRVGAADDLARGRSTFMVEMVETATILNLATDRSLVILDEIGRGTATYDGLSIAWACIEHLHEVNHCRSLFATHFHELTALSAKLDRVTNATLKVREWEGEVIFLHDVVPGTADRSYGIQVAKLAGLPRSVIDRAAQVLELLEEGERSQSQARIIDDLPLFSVPASSTSPATQSAHSELVEKLEALLPDELSPREALDVIYQLKKLAADGDNS